MDYAAARLHMVDSQIKTNKVTDTRLLEAFEEVPRERFVHESQRGYAYIDEDLKVADERYLVEPMVQARMIQAADIKSSDVVLDIGAGPGYSTAIIARVAATVVALESDEGLAKHAIRTLEELGVDNAIVIKEALTEGYPKQAPFNVILINGAVSEVPKQIVDQLADGGRLVTVIRGERGVGRATYMERLGDTISRRELFDAATPFLPGFRRQPGFVF